jgi:hypothetical protein
VLTGTVALTAAALVSVQGAHGQLSFDEFSRSEVAATRYVYEHAAPGSVLIEPTGNLPGKLTANYNEVDVRGADKVLMAALPRDRSTITEDDIAAVDDFAQGFDAPTYLIITHSMIMYGHYFGYWRDGMLENFNAALSKAPEWKVIYRAPDAVVYRYIPA